MQVLTTLVMQLFSQKIALIAAHTHDASGASLLEVHTRLQVVAYLYVPARQ